MTYADELKKPGREPVVIVEMDLGYCSLTYGVAPCTASIGTTGIQKCFNTRKTCQDAANFTQATKTYRFSSKHLPASAPSTIPNVMSVRMTPTKIAPGQGMGQRASVSITFQDSPLGDFGIDKYAGERTYDSRTQGTFWGKFIARNPYFAGRPLRVRTGFLDDGAYDAANFQTRLYFIEKIDGPNSKGIVTVTAKDILKLLDDERSQIPEVSLGKLSVAVDEIATSLVLGDGEGAEYPASGEIRVGSEIMTFTRSVDTMTVVRARESSEAASHDIGESVQICKRYTEVPIADLVYDLMTDAGTIDPSYCDLTAWQTECELWLPYHLMSALITSPTGVRKLLEELAQSALVYYWWNEVSQTVELRAIRPPDEAEVSTLNDTENIVADSVTVSQDVESRISEIWVYYGIIDPTKDLEEEHNYTRVEIYVDTDAESDIEYAEQRIKKIFSRWLRTDVQTPAQTLAARMIAKYRDTPRTIKVRLDAKDSEIWIADPVRLTTKWIQGPDGSSQENDLQVMRVTEVETGTLYEYELSDSFFKGRYFYFMDDADPDYSAASDARKRKAGYFGNDDGVYPYAPLPFSDGGDPYKLI